MDGGGFYLGICAATDSIDCNFSSCRAGHADGAADCGGGACFYFRQYEGQTTWTDKLARLLVTDSGQFPVLIWNPDNWRLVNVKDAIFAHLGTFGLAHILSSGGDNVGRIVFETCVFQDCPANPFIGPADGGWGFAEASITLKGCWFDGAVPGASEGLTLSGNVADAALARGLRCIRTWDEVTSGLCE